jgi:hypothetical protein
MIGSTVVWRRENSVNSGNVGPSRPHMFFKAFHLHFVCSDDGQKTILFQKHLTELFPENNRTISQVIMVIELLSHSFFVLCRI